MTTYFYAAGFVLLSFVAFKANRAFRFRSVFGIFPTITKTSKRRKVAEAIVERQLEYRARGVRGKHSIYLAWGIVLSLRSLPGLYETRLAHILKNDQNFSGKMTDLKTAHETAQKFGFPVKPKIEDYILNPLDAAE